MMSNAKKYLKLKFYVENNISEWVIFLCIFFVGISIGDKEATSLGIVCVTIPMWFFFREKVSYDIKLIPISDKEIKTLNNKYRIIKYVEWISFAVICFLLHRFSKSIVYSIGFFIIFSFLYLTYTLTKFLKREF